MTLKSVEHPSDTIGELRERWDDRFTLASPALLKRYVEGELSIHLHIRCLLDGGSAEFCAVFERANHLGTTHGEIEAFHGAFPLPGCEPKREGLPAQGAADNVDKSVLISHVEFVDVPERVFAKLVPSLVRLKPLDCVHDSDAGSLLFLGSSGFVFLGVPFFGFPDDGKLRPGVGFTAVGEHQLVHQVVERGTQVVDRVPDDEAEPEGPDDEAEPEGGILRNPSGRDLLSRLRVTVKDDSVGVEVKEGLDFKLEVLDVLVGPFNLTSRSVEGVRHGVNSCS
jgi:hypothetical protein